MTQEKIIYTGWAVSNVFKDGTIEMHKDLQKPKWKPLHDKILNHERNHDFNKGFWYNTKVDFFNFIGLGELLQFMASRPKTWIQLLPVYYTKSKGVIYDKSMLLFYSIIAAEIIIIIKLMG